VKARALSYPSPVWGRDERSSLLGWHIESAMNDVPGEVASEQTSFIMAPSGFRFQLDI
jgi:hypothetical protein